MVDDEVSGDGAKPSRRRPAPATRTSERRESRVEPSLARRHRREHRDRAIAKRGRKERASNERRPRARRSDRAACTRPATRGQAVPGASRIDVARSLAIVLRLTRRPCGKVAWVARTSLSVASILAATSRERVAKVESFIRTSTYPSNAFLVLDPTGFSTVRATMVS